MKLEIFNNPQFGEIRTTSINNEPWFVGKDIAEALGYSDTSDALKRHVDAEDKLTRRFTDSGQGRDMTVLNESGLYSLIMSSKLPTAKQFKHWVTSDVLPTIRKHGAYMTDRTIEEALLNPDTLIRLATELKEERTARQQLESQAQENRPMVVLGKAVTASDSCILIGELAKLINQNGVQMGQKRLFAWLRENGYLIRKHGSDYNLPTQYSMERKLFEIKESVHIDGNGCNRTTRTPKVTGKGQAYFINKFLGNREEPVKEEPEA